jgi:hypothetical protein
MKTITITAAGMVFLQKSHENQAFFSGHRHFYCMKFGIEIQYVTQSAPCYGGRLTEGVGCFLLPTF